MILTRRQFEAAQFLAEGLSYKEVAQHLHIAVGTAKYHGVQIYRKCGFPGDTCIKRVQFSMWWIKQGWQNYRQYLDAMVGREGKREVKIVQMIRRTA